MEDDRELIEKLRQGHPEAFERLLKVYGQTLLNFIYRYTGDRFCAEDILQETLLRVYRAVSGFELRENARFSTWLFRIAYNLCLNEISRRKRVFRFFEEFRRYCLTDMDPVQGVLAGQPPDEAAAGALKAMQSLPEQQRAALLLKVNDEFSYAEIAVILGVSVSSVESLIFRARRRLKKMAGKTGPKVTS